MRLTRLPLLIGALALAAGALGCSEERTTKGGNGGSGGSGGSRPVSETTIYSIQNPETQPAIGSDVVLRDVVVTAVVERRQADGNYAPQHFFVQEPAGGKWSGVYVYNGSDGKPVVTVPEVGDRVSLAGKLAEYYDRTQIEVLTLNILGKGTVPPPATVDPEAIATGGAEQEAWEGVLVQVLDTVVTDAEALDSSGVDRGNFRINTYGRTEGGVLVGTTFRTGYVRVAGDRFLSVVGILDYSYAESKLEPRSAQDITFLDGSHPGVVDAGEKTIYQLQNPAAEGAVHPPANVTVRDVIVTANGGNRIWVQEEAGGPWSGIQVRLPSDVTAPAVGSKVTVQGLYTEYYGAAQIDQATIVSTAEGTLPAPHDVTVEEIRTGSATAEQWEGVFLRIRDVQNVQDPVLGTDNVDRGDFRVAPIAEPTVENGVLIGHAFFNDYAESGKVGDKFQSITGVLDYTYSDYVLQPRGNADIVLEDGSNPQPPPATVVTIQQIQDPEAANKPAVNTRVRVENVVVTHAFSNGFFVQDPNGSSWSGIYVYKPARVTDVTIPARGQLVNVEGKYIEYKGSATDSNEVSEIEVSKVEVVGAGTEPAPVVATAAELNGGSRAEELEGVLVRVENVVNIQDPVLGTDGIDRGDFRIAARGETTGPVVTNKTIYAGQQGDEFRSIVGVLHFGYGEWRIELRDASDITFADGSNPAARVVTIEQIQDRSHAEAVAENSAVRLENVVVTASGGSGFFVAEGAGAWKGIYVFDRTGTQSLPAIGKVVNVEGKYVEYERSAYAGQGKVSEIELTKIEVVGDGSVPPFTVVTPALLADAAQAEAYEGVLVELTNVSVSNPDLGFYTYQVAGSLVVGTTYFRDYTPALGDAFLSIKGVLHFDYGTFRLEPRMATDITFLDGTNPGGGGEQPGATVVTIYDVQDESSENHPAVNSQVEIRDVVVTAIKTGNQGLTGVYVSEPEGGPYSGIYLFKKSNSVLPADIGVGDVISVTGKYIEYSYNGARALSEIEIGEITRSSVGNGTVQVTPVTAEQIAANNPDAEMYENCLVQVENLTVTPTPAASSYYRAQATVDADTSDEVFLGKVLYPGLTLTENQHLSSVTGILDDFSGTYRLHARGAEDIETP